MKEINPDIVAFNEYTTNELRRISSNGVSNIEIIHILATLESLKMNFTLQLIDRFIKENKVT